MAARITDTKRNETKAPTQASLLSALHTFLNKKPLIFALTTAALAIIILAPVSATAALQEQQATPTPNPNLSIGNDTCLECHGKSGLTMKLDDGEELSLYIDPQEYASSIHGKDGYACVQCHITVGNYPHPLFNAADRRDASLKLYPACYRCHSGEYERSLDSVHTAAMTAGNVEAAICTDCHTAHSVRQLNDVKTGHPLPDTRTWIPQTCALCHNAIYQEYLTSVHGSALEEGNPDVPTCIDCHGVHNISSPLTNAFRLGSPDMCAKCHTDPQIMAKYGISTQVLNTYVADFHGTTVEIFDKESPDAPTNKPVCFDCHGVHDIARIDDPQKGLLIKQNLLARCKVCHPDATSNFPSAWLSHYIPSAKQNSLVYYVGWFYKLLIPVLIGGMALLVTMDLGRLLLNRYRKDRPEISGPVPEDSKVPHEQEALDTEKLESSSLLEIQPPSTEENPSNREQARPEIVMSQPSSTPVVTKTEPELPEELPPVPPPSQPSDEEASDD